MQQTTRHVMKSDTLTLAQAKSMFALYIINSLFKKDCPHLPVISVRCIAYLTEQGRKWKVQRISWSFRSLEEGAHKQVSRNPDD